MEEAAEADYIVILDGGRIAAEGTPLELKNAYTEDYVMLYGAGESDVAPLGVKYELFRGGARLCLPNTARATELIVANPALFRDYEITKGKMDDVFYFISVDIQEEDINQLVIIFMMINMNCLFKINYFYFYHLNIIF